MKRALIIDFRFCVFWTKALLPSTYMKHLCVLRSNAKNLIHCNWWNLHCRIWKLDYYNRWIISGLANATLLPNTFLCWIGYCGFLLHGLTAIVKFKGCSSFILVVNYHQQQDRLKYNSAVKGLTFVAHVLLLICIVYILH